MAHIINVRLELEAMLEAGALVAGLDSTQENQRAVLEYVLGELKKDLENSNSISEKLWIRKYIQEATLMIEDLEGAS